VVMLAVIAALLVAMAWIAAGDRADGSLRDPSGVTHTDRDANGTVSPVDLTDAVVTPVLGAARAAELRLAPLWVLPGLTAALAALCLLRRLRRSPTLSARRALLRGSRSNRAPPTGSFV
jgi:hypothetical protein